MTRHATARLFVAPQNLQLERTTTWLPLPLFTLLRLLAERAARVLLWQVLSLLLLLLLLPLELLLLLLCR